MLTLRAHEEDRLRARQRCDLGSHSTEKWKLMSTIILSSAPADTQDAKRYASGMAEIRQRLGFARTAVSRIRETQNQDLVNTETIFLQMRKVCELVAFGSLIANKELYSQHYETFASDWRLGRLVDKLRKVNPDFFPVPMSTPYEVAPGHKQAGPSLALTSLKANSSTFTTSVDASCTRAIHFRPLMLRIGSDTRSTNGSPVLKVCCAGIASSWWTARCGW